MAGISRNAPCPCGSGKKFKHCCMRPNGSASTTAGLGEVPQWSFGTAEECSPALDEIVTQRKAWLGEHEKAVAATAWQAFQSVGRGVLVIRENRTEMPEIEYWSMTALPSGPEGEDERHMCADYDPEKEVIVRFEGLLISNFRIRPEVAPPDVYAEAQRLTQNN